MNRHNLKREEKDNQKKHKNKLKFNSLRLKGLLKK
jgi:hypothetical protein